MPAAYDALLQNFADTFQLPVESLAVSPEITVNDVVISLHYEGLEDGAGDVLLYAVLGSPPPGTEDAACRAMLLANHLWSGTGGATLGLMDDGRATMSYRTPLATLHAEGLATTLDLFSEQALQWRELIQLPEAIAEMNAGVPA
ncbi:MAG: CesT family type III secretion system chaperone [Verrucomicrobiales bacterium]|nr:CesT family type III secretion system chaperone [Verrucomicrobiales bacterium]